MNVKCLERHVAPSLHSINVVVIIITFTIHFSQLRVGCPCLFDSHVYNQSLPLPGLLPTSVIHLIFDLKLSSNSCLKLRQVLLPCQQAEFLQGPLTNLSSLTFSSKNDSQRHRFLKMLNIELNIMSWQIQLTGCGFDSCVFFAMLQSSPGKLYDSVKIFSSHLTNVVQLNSCFSFPTLRHCQESLSVFHVFILFIFSTSILLLCSPKRSQLYHCRLLLMYVHLVPSPKL